MADLPVVVRPKAFIAHATPGRVRLRVPERRYDDEFFSAVRQQISTWPGIDDVRVNPITASVLVLFSDPAAALLYAQTSDLFELSDREVVPHEELLADSAGEKMQSTSRWIRELTGGVADPRSIMFVALALAAIYAIYRGNIRTPAFTLLLYAGAILRLWSTAEPAIDAPSTP